jgi:hypothetical protein
VGHQRDMPQRAALYRAYERTSASMTIMAVRGARISCFATVEPTR